MLALGLSWPMPTPRRLPKLLMLPRLESSGIAEADGAGGEVEVAGPTAAAAVGSADAMLFARTRRLSRWFSQLPADLPNAPILPV